MGKIQVAKAVAMNMRDSQSTVHKASTAFLLDMMENIFGP